MPNVNEIPTQVREAAQKGQHAVTETVKQWSDTVSNAVPGVSLPTVGRYLPQAKAAVNSAFDIAEQAVARQREFVIGVLDSVEHRLTAVETDRDQASTETKTTSKTAKSAAPA